MVLVSNASLRASLTSSTRALGMRVLSHARILGIDAYGAGAARQLSAESNTRLLTKIKKRMPKVQFCKKYGAFTSKIAKAGLMPSGLHGVRCMGMTSTRLKAFRTTIGRCLPGKHAGRSLTWRLAMYRVRSGTPVQNRANRSVGRGSVGRAAGRCRSAQGLETTATIGGLETVVEHGQWPNGRHPHVPEAAGFEHGLTTRPLSLQLDT